MPHDFENGAVRIFHALLRSKVLVAIRIPDPEEEEAEEEEDALPARAENALPAATDPVRTDFLHPEVAAVVGKIPSPPEPGAQSGCVVYHPSSRLCRAD